VGRFPNPSWCRADYAVEIAAALLELRNGQRQANVDWIREHSSGGRQRLGGISKQGNRFMRFLLVEAVHNVTRLDEGFRKQYQQRCHRMEKKVAKVAAARRLAVRTLLDAAHPHPVSGDRLYREQPAGAPGRSPQRLDRDVDWALSPPAQAEGSHNRIMVAVVAESMVGGTKWVLPETDEREFSSDFRPQSCWRASGAGAPPQVGCRLTTPSTLSRATGGLISVRSTEAVAGR
jgi:Transposase IS116/IS110/IS902 family